MNIELGIFDIEGTILDELKLLPQTVQEGLGLMRNKRIATTVITGTGFIRVKSMLGNLLDIVVSEEALIGVENGGRIVDKFGTTIMHFPLTPAEQKPIIDYLSKSVVEFVVYYPYPRERALIWTPNEGTGRDLRDKHSSFADVQVSTIDEFRESMESDSPSVVIFRPSSFESLTSLKDTNSVLNEGYLHVNSSGVNKGKAVQEIAKKIGVDLSRVMVAGNYLNDLPMFESGAQYKVFVGKPLKEFSHIKDITYVDNVEEFGRLLMTLFK